MSTNWTESEQAPLLVENDMYERHVYSDCEQENAMAMVCTVWASHKRMANENVAGNGTYVQTSCVNSKRINDMKVYWNLWWHVPSHGNQLRSSRREVKKEKKVGPNL